MRIERLYEIENYIVMHETASLEELCAHFNVSMNTIRRDINELEKQGVLTKVYGGVTANASKHIIPIHKRSTLEYSHKREIGKVAASLVEDKDVLFIDSGTTTVQLLSFLPPNINIRIFSHSLPVLIQASQLPNVSLFALGGEYNSKTDSFAGITTINEINDIYFTKAFMAATAVSIEGGVANNTYLEAAIKQAAVKQCKKIIVMADNSKLTATASIRFSHLKDINTFVTYEKPQPQFTDFFASHHITLLCAKDFASDEK